MTILLTFAEPENAVATLSRLLPAQEERTVSMSPLVVPLLLHLAIFRIEAEGSSSIPRNRVGAILDLSIDELS